jgi:hypothetical protein
MAEVPAAAPEEARPRAAVPGFGIAEVQVRGFRSARDVAFAPGPICALVGEASAGKSNLLAAIRSALDPTGAPLGAGDAIVGGDRSISIRLALAGGGEVALEGTPERPTHQRPAETPPVLFLPAVARASTLVADGEPKSAQAARAVDVFREALDRGGSSSAAAALAAVDAVESCCALGVHGLVVLIEEPELYLRPQRQRYLYRVLRRLAGAGNQVIYSTHSPAFLNVARLDEIVLVEQLPDLGTRAAQPAPVTPEEDFRVLTEFDAARSELFLARAVVLVEGQTEKLVLPFVFRALGHDPDREAISIIECGGKSNIPLFARVCGAVGVPYVALYDSDERPGRKPIASEVALNELIRATVDARRRIELHPDFEAAVGLTGHRRKPERAWRRFAALSRDEVPEPLARVVELAATLVREGRTGGPAQQGSTLSAGSTDAT